MVYLTEWNQTAYIFVSLKMLHARVGCACRGPQPAWWFRCPSPKLATCQSGSSPSNACVLCLPRLGTLSPAMLQVSSAGLTEVTENKIASLSNQLCARKQATMSLQRMANT
eukprot:3974430-Amphidinium_carterae.1